MCHILFRAVDLSAFEFSLTCFSGIVLNPCVVFNTVTSYVVLLD